MFFASAQRDVQQGVDRYCRHIEDAMAALQGALARYVETQDREALRADVPTVHRNESAADDVRGDIEGTHVSRGVFPESAARSCSFSRKWTACRTGPRPPSA